MEETNGKMTSGKKKWGTLILMAVVFGLIAGGIMYGVNAVGNRISSEKNISKTETVQKSGADQNKVCGPYRRVLEKSEGLHMRL